MIWPHFKYKIDFCSLFIVDNYVFCFDMMVIFGAIKGQIKGQLISKLGESLRDIDIKKSHCPL